MLNICDAGVFLIFKFGKTGGGRKGKSQDDATS
jgi:hypothetical protein